MADGIDRPPRRSREIVAGGALSGIVAGLAMAAAAMAYAVTLGLEPFFPAKQIAAALFGVSALIGGAPVVLAGLLVRAAYSAALGILFALAISGRTHGATAFAAGVAYGVALWAVMTLVVLPAVNPVMLGQIELIPVAWFVYHLIFGAVLAITPALERATGPRRGHPVPA